MKNRAAFLFLLVIMLAVTSCRKEESAQPVDAGLEYFPITVGSWIEYQVDSIWRDDTFNVHDTISYRLKQVIAANYTDPEGRPSQRIERFILNENDEWVIRDVWTATRTTTGLELTEENQRKLKLSFPVREARTWDVNILNTEDELMVAAREVNEAHVLNGQNFSNTVKVRTTVAGNPIITRDLEEVYAHGIGMIEHHWYFRRALDFTDENVVSVKYSMVMVAHGN